MHLLLLRRDIDYSEMSGWPRVNLILASSIYARQNEFSKKSLVPTMQRPKLSSRRFSPSAMDLQNLLQRNGTSDTLIINAIARAHICTRVNDGTL